MGRKCPSGRTKDISGENAESSPGHAMALLCFGPKNGFCMIDLKSRTLLCTNKSGVRCPMKTPCLFRSCAVAAQKKVHYDVFNCE